MGQLIGSVSLPEAGSLPELPPSGYSARTQDVATLQKDADRKLGVGASRSLRLDYANKEIANDGYQREAQTARNANRVLRAMQDILTDINRHLQVIVKNYPPFPPDSAERQAYLNSISGLRKQLAAMIIPPPPDKEPLVELRFYPRLDARVLTGIAIDENLLPDPLDPARASDEQVAAIQEQTQNILSTVDTFLARLKSNVEQLAWSIGQYPDEDAERIIKQVLQGLTDARTGIGVDVHALISAGD